MNNRRIGGAKTRAASRKYREKYKKKLLLQSIRRGTTLKKRKIQKSPLRVTAKKTRRKRKLKCWSRNTRSGKHYVVCSGSKGQQIRKSSRLKKLRGGLGNSLFPQELVNTGRNITYNIASGYNDALGKTPPVNPDPTIQPINNSNNLVNYKNSNIPKYYNSSQKIVGQF